MQFHELLNDYIEKLNCTAQELADASGLSPAVISRYRTGNREPASNSKQLIMLCRGIVSLTEAKELPALSEDDVLFSFKNILDSKHIDFEQIRNNFNTLVSILDININDLARTINFDPSYLSRIRSGQRKPTNIQSFCNDICRFIVRKYTEPDKRLAIAKLIQCEDADYNDNTTIFGKLSEWLCHNTESSEYIDNFLKKLDEFNLDEYIRAIHFDELKVPSVPFQLPTSKTYHGTEQFKQGELDFFKSTILSKSTEPIFMCNDMPLSDMAEDTDFDKKWMFAIAMSLKKGLHLNIIHNIDRPFNEMMLGLEAWIPIYMTGQISPYYLKGRHNSVYCHFNYVSGHAALAGECINGFHDDGKYYLTTNKEEVSYYKKKAKHLLTKAQPLMDIYRKDTEHIYTSFLNKDSLTEGNRYNILSSLPIYTISEELLSDILKRNLVPEADISNLLVYAKEQRHLLENILEKNSVVDEVLELSKEEFARYPMAPSLSGAFYEKEILYTYEEYLKHLNLTKEYSLTHSNYTVKTQTGHAFRNIQIQIHEGTWVMLSKNKAPTIHFVIHHPKMINAFENFAVAVTD